MHSIYVSDGDYAKAKTATGHVTVTDPGLSLEATNAKRGDRIHVYKVSELEDDEIDLQDHLVMYLVSFNGDAVVITQASEWGMGGAMSHLRLLD